jgi:hypothetical protein
MGITALWKVVMAALQALALFTSPRNGSVEVSMHKDRRQRRPETALIGVLKFCCSMCCAVCSSNAR